MKDKVLDKFLWECKKQAAKSPKPTPKPQVSQYANPDNWYTTRTVELICRASDGSSEHLGFFREERCLCSPTARRLQPIGLQDPSLVIAKEVVSGSYWTKPYTKPVHIDTTEEVEALRLRFFELLALQE